LPEEFLAPNEETTSDLKSSLRQWKQVLNLFIAPLPTTEYQKKSRK
jgi:hypothetical protein